MSGSEPKRAGIPAFINAKSGSADKVREALEGAPGLDVRSVEPDGLGEELRQAVSGVAEAAAEAGAELAVIPGGTLNHFAKAVGIPEDAAEAASLATSGETRTVDMGYVNDKLFLNTSSVGAYVLFVRTRDRMEGYHIPYAIASLLAFVRVLAGLRTFRVAVEIEGERRVYDTPLVFVGVGEREIGIPTLGGRVEGGRRGLHIIVISGRRRASLVLLGVVAAARGVEVVSRAPRSGLDAFIADRCTIESRRPSVTVGVDGELVTVRTPLEYRAARDALRVVAPPEGAGGEGGAA
ncbi:MAG: diacylglycerol kinase family protein [Gemmatimonadaceae bacterium]